MQEEGAAGNFEEYKSEDEMHRVLSDSEESKKSDREDAPRGRGGNIDSQASDEQSDEEENCNPDEEPFLEPGTMCSEHKNLKVHSWHKKTRELLCTYCI